MIQQLSVNNSNAGGGFYSQGGQFYYVRGLGLMRDTKDIGDVIVGSQNGSPRAGAPHRRHDHRQCSAARRIRIQQTDDAVEGVIMMRRGEQTQDVLKGVEAKTASSTSRSCRRISKSVPTTIAATSSAHHRHRRAQHGPGDDTRAVVLMVFLVSLRAAVIVALTIPVACCFPSSSCMRVGRRQPAFHRRHRLRDPDRRHPGHGGEHLPRAGRARRHQL